MLHTKRGAASRIPLIKLPDPRHRFHRMGHIIRPGLPFAKYGGAGNDFVIVDAATAGNLDPAALAERLCARATGVGVDGLALVEVREAGRLAVRFFNPDGSEFGTCGNGSRCVALWADDRGHAPGGSLTISTSDGPIGATVREDRVALDYALEARIERQLDLTYAGRPQPAWLVQIGTPHLVVPLDVLPEGPLEPLARPLRHHPDLGPAGANVNFVVLEAPDRAAIRTFERGIEAETLACGAGSMASTLVLREARGAGVELVLRTRSGEELEVRVGGAEEGGIRHIRLAGPARRFFEGWLYETGPVPDGAGPEEEPIP